MTKNENFNFVSRLKPFTRRTQPEDIVAETTKDRYRQLDVENHYWSPDMEYYETVYEHEDTGIITADPFKFEEWMKGLKS